MSWRIYFYSQVLSEYSQQAIYDSRSPSNSKPSKPTIRRPFAFEYSYFYSHLTHRFYSQPVQPWVNAGAQQLALPAKKIMELHANAIISGDESIDSEKKSEPRDDNVEDSFEVLKTLRHCVSDWSYM